MERIEDIETFYQKENEKLDKAFLDKVKGLKNITEAKSMEKSYKEQLSVLREQYNKRFNAFVLDQKNRIIKDHIARSKKSIKGTPTKPLEIRTIDLKDNWKTRLKIRWELFKFNFHLKKNNFFRAITINPIIRMRVKTKILKKRSAMGLSNFITRSVNMTIGFFVKLFTILKNILLKSIGLIKNFFKAIFRFIRKLFSKKKKEDNREKRPDEEIAERILQKSQENK